MPGAQGFQAGLMFGRRRVIPFIIFIIAELTYINARFNGVLMLVTSDKTCC